MFNVSIISLSIFNVNRLIAFPYEIAGCSEKRQDMPESAALAVACCRAGDQAMFHV
jgi:hypothetical protein